jgi:hypothetical protein
MNTWDEKNSTEPKKNCLDSKENEVNDIIKNAVIQSEKEECNSIGWKRNCPKCGEVVTHKNKYRCKYAIENGSVCRKCMLENLQSSNVGKKRTKETSKL